MQWLVKYLIATSAGLAATISVNAAETSVRDICDKCVVEKVATCGGFLEGTTTSPDGKLWFVDLTGDRILALGPNNECEVKGKTGSAPNGAKFAPDGRLLMTARHGLIAMDPKTAAVTVLVDSFEGKPLQGVNDLALDAKGGIYFTLPGGSSVTQPNGRVFYLAPGAKVPTVLADNIAYPNGIAISPDGRGILVAEFAAKRVLSLPAPSATTGIALAYVYATTQGGIGPDGILVDQQGRLYAANFGASEVAVFANDGRSLGSIRLPDGAGRFVTNVAIVNDYLYLSEAEKGEIWRVKLTKNAGGK